MVLSLENSNIHSLLSWTFSLNWADDYWKSSLNSEYPFLKNPIAYFIKEGLPKMCFFFIFSSAEFVHFTTLFFFKKKTQPKFVSLLKIFLPTYFQSSDLLTRMNGDIASAHPIPSLETAT